MKTNKDQKETISAAFTVVLAAVTLTFFIFCGGLTYWYFIADHVMTWVVISPILIVCGLLWIMLACMVALVFLAIHLWLVNRVRSSSTIRQNATSVKQTSNYSPLLSEMANHLRRRYNLFWRSQVRLLLVCGEPEHIAAIAPGLAGKQWLEGRRTVLIYGGSLSSAPDT
ncbi:type VI secretion protein VasK, partial [Klebsiella michiganensis]|nr:type VI secretion protein VasK [Klebsiella michiganensis]